MGVRVPPSAKKTAIYFSEYFNPVWICQTGFFVILSAMSKFPHERSSTTSGGAPAPDGNVESGADVRNRKFATFLQVVDKHPLLIVFGSAIILRLVAVFFSKGYMASDDHFETVKIAFEWLQHGSPFNADGLLTWNNTIIGGVTRFPLYTLSLYALFVVERWLGMTSLDQMMYGMRLAHVGISLLAVWAVYRAVALVTKSTRWAVLGGLFVSAHFLMPYLSVRNLIEMVGGNIFIVAIYYLYRWRDGAARNLSERKTNLLLIVAGIITGLAWMVRFEIALAAAPIPFVLWYQSRRLRTALWYSAGVLVMVLLSGVVDYALIGSFMASTVNHLSQVQHEGAVYQTSFFIYLSVITLFLIPPFAFVFYWLCLSRNFCREHALLLVSVLSFVILHMVAESRQERYMIPIIPVLLLLVTLALWNRYQSHGYILKSRKLFTGIVATTVIANFALLPVFMFHYGHKGIVEPFVRLADSDPAYSRAGTLIVSPAFRTWFPTQYAADNGRSAQKSATVSASDKAIQYVFSWSELESCRATDSWLADVEYIFVYPGSPDALSETLDSLQMPDAQFAQSLHITPSLMGQILHWLNPRHNPTYEVWVYRRI